MSADPSALPDHLGQCLSVGTGGCWLWLRALDRDSYGLANYRGKRWRAHRLVYTLLSSPIPDGLQIDHLCRVAACCNPAHLEPVTPRENVLRSRGLPALNVAKTQCPSGHPYSGDNLYIGSDRRRVCRTCNRDRARQRYWAAKGRTA